MEDEVDRKIVAIGGGQNGRLKPDGTREPYETAVMDREIIRLTGKQYSNFLFLGHAQTNPEAEAGYFATMKNIYGEMYGCRCEAVTRKELMQRLNTVSESVHWADIIYVGGGSTLDMMELWKETGFHEVLRAAWESGKVMCGVSAGANCWFQECLSDSLKIKYGPDQPYMVMECLGFVEGLFVPHCEEPGKQEAVKESLGERNTISIQTSNGAALEIIGDKYRILTADVPSLGRKAYGLRTHWKDHEYLEEIMKSAEEFRPLRELLH